MPPSDPSIELELDLTPGSPLATPTVEPAPHDRPRRRARGPLAHRVLYAAAPAVVLVAVAGLTLSIEERRSRTDPVAHASSSGALEALAGQLRGEPILDEHGLLRAAPVASGAELQARLDLAGTWRTDGAGLTALAPHLVFYDTGILLLAGGPRVRRATWRLRDGRLDILDDAGDTFTAIAAVEPHRLTLDLADGRRVVYQR